ncbi:MAG: signal peptidase I [candidate division NC10 bacterium]|nr:signal peptidase I [candidate division NC10 bacterium]
MTRPMMDETIKEDQEQASQPGAKSTKSVFRQYTEAVIIAVILALVIRTFVVQAFKIPSGSMLQTLQVGDHILVNKFLYWFTDPQHGDIIVFKYPQDEERDFIKRVIALSGEKVEIREKQVYINDKPLTEPYAIHLDPATIENPGSPRDSFGPVVVAPGQLFMMGDNRDYSMDSRFWGFLDMKKIKGKAFVIYWSWDHERFRPRWERIGMLVR